MKHSYSRSTRIIVPALLCLLGLGLADALAQERATAARATVALAAGADGRLPVELQRSLEAESARLTNPDCGSECKPNPGSRLVSPGGGSGPRYVCNHGSCACAGACDCQTMGTICAPNTMACSDYGCTCAEAEGAEHPEGGACEG